MRIPPSVEALIVVWERLDRERARWEQRTGTPWPSLEEQAAYIDRLRAEQGE